MTLVHRLSPAVTADAGVLGGKAHGLVVMMGLGLPVPPGFVIATSACRAFLRDGRLPGGLEAAICDMRPAERVSVRSGAAVSMPGMMDTFLNVRPGRGVLEAVAAVFASWHSPRATSYRHLHDIPHDLGTAVIVQAMVFGDRDEHSGSGVAFSRDPSTGAPSPYGEVLFGRPGADVVSGRTATRPLAELADREPGVWAALLDGLARVERHYRDVCHVEFTFESGRLWFLQVRPGGLAGRAAVRVAVDLVDEGVIDRATAVRRVSAAQLRAARTPRIVAARVLARGLGASPGVAAGRIAVTADRAARMAPDGPVILVRPHTSPLDMHGLAAAAGIVTTVGGPTSHAAVVARSMGRPAVVGASALTVDPGAGIVRVDGRSLPEGVLITIDGSGGEIVAGPAETVAGDADPHLQRLVGWAAPV
ncbi:PEP/pyruvate-binding domain-containing protein [Actinoplanes sp. NEAU-A12]|uniref:PEP/pyruvate-binding domain-containing protein n=1 Tax=Actinoplanes sandaracinus TaxID=3045177 RepID=A0ABT6WRN9_9ACTN|nr:PEP/pyruvate-binding domain-containing protein [Actinoplanes sandaracinus]MDI6102358.1 PEP/pyruvate-binding domain-containing protein [Actinoplanes sandaracinus]